MIWGQRVEGWFLNKNYGQYQQTRGRVVVYVERQLFNYRVNLYHRGVLAMCELEARVESGFEPDELFAIGEAWLKKYEDGHQDEIAADPFYVWNPKGVWGFTEARKNYINNYTEWRENYGGGHGVCRDGDGDPVEQVGRVV